MLNAIYVPFGRGSLLDGGGVLGAGSSIFGDLPENLLIRLGLGRSATDPRSGPLLAGLYGALHGRGSLLDGGGVFGVGSSIGGDLPGNLLIRPCLGGSAMTRIGPWLARLRRVSWLLIVSSK